ncbi:PP2C family serine/threonine-protein phosphatase [Umezawaea tangerina]|uniref:Serine/threonine protein phosphatase PrpC n=1 Tax=Umezawaea tangerina TaxID=84725 RepID=A0A2T0SN35_9PSEU|nr:PP2C family serine/threonine-protein phosphatase [Umezawaea tangerina]PRY34805.1 serine/threonine protein phosphatase PrpC [Umezawaea tangerina]
MTNCPECDEPVAAEDRFCESCGRNLLVRTTPVGGPDGTAAALCACGSTEIDEEGFCEQCGRAQPVGRDRMEFVLPTIAGISDRGRRRARNEDSMAFGHVHARGVAAIVCDGVASSERADEASQAAVDAANAVLVDALVEGTDPERATVLAVAAANRAAGALARAEAPDVAPSCTYVSAMRTDDGAVVGWVGDSRAYWLADVGNATPSRRLTKDDTWAAQLVADGVLTEAEAVNDRRSHVLSRWLGGDSGQVSPHVVALRPEESGVVLLCSDGLWNYLPEVEDLDAARTRGTTPVELARELTEHALAAGGHDNITVVVIEVGGGRGR